MLDESRFPHFKYQLAALLTANQELDFQMKAARIIGTAKENFPAWHEQLMSNLKTDQEQAKSVLRLAQSYQKSGCEGLMELLMQFDNDLDNSGVFPRDKAAFEYSGLIRRMTWIVMRNLLQIDPQTADEQQIRKALQDASEELASNPEELLEKLICENMQKVNEYLIAARKRCGLTEDALMQRLESWKKTMPFPQMDKRVYDLQGTIDAGTAVGRIRTKNVVELAKWISSLLSNTIYSYQIALQEQTRSYIASWRSQILKQNHEDKNEMGRIAENAAEQIRNILQQENSATVNYESYLSVLAQAEKEMNNN